MTFTKLAFRDILGAFYLLVVVLSARFAFTVACLLLATAAF